MIARKVYYTAVLVVPDGTDSDVYGEGTTPGDGTRLESGWISLDYSGWTVFANREDVAPDTFDPDDDLDSAAWLAQTLSERIGAGAHDNGDGTWYSEDGEQNFETGVDRTLAAHAYGFTEDELARASDLLRASR